MPDDKQDQNVEAGGTAIQAGGNVTIQNKGFSPAEIKEIADLCFLLLRNNFQALREDAIKAAEINVRKFAVDLESKILEKSNKLVLEKFTDPDVQAMINDAVQAAARKGEKSNPSILVDLIVERASEAANDFKDIVLSEAVIVVPKLTNAQIAYLSFIHYMVQANINGIKHISQLEPYSQLALALVSQGFNLSNSQKRHIRYASTCSIASMMKVNIYDGWMKTLYKSLGYTDINLFKDDIAKFSPSSKVLLEVFDKDSKDGEVTLTSVGQAIAIANLSTIFGELDYSVWLK